MGYTLRDLHLLALKLLETFAADRMGMYPFDRYWPLAGPLEAFSASAVTSLEQEIANALRRALEQLLKKAAPGSIHADAGAVGVMLGAAIRKRRPWKPYRAVPTRKTTRKVSQSTRRAHTRGRLKPRDR